MPAAHGHGDRAVGWHQPEQVGPDGIGDGALLRRVGRCLRCGGGESHGRSLLRTVGGRLRPAGSGDRRPGNGRDGGAEPYGAWPGSARVTATSGRRMRISTVRSLGQSQISSRRTASASDARQAASSDRSSRVARCRADSSNRSLWVSQASEIGVVAGREKAGAKQFGEPVRLERAVRGDQRQGLVEPRPGLAGEGEIGRHVERRRMSRRRADGELDADRGGPGRQ